MNGLHLNAAAETTLVSIHDVMKQPFRRVYGKVYVTYTDPLINDAISDIVSSGEAYNSQVLQLSDGFVEPDHRFFALYDNDLSGAYAVSSAASQVGWTSDVLSSADGTFASPPHILLRFVARPIVSFVICFDRVRGNIATSFDVDITYSGDKVLHRSITNNTQYNVELTFDEVLAEATSIMVTINSIAVPNAPVTVLDVPIASKFLYDGYLESSNLIGIDLLEELTYDDEIEALGGISANEVTVVFDNTSKLFNFNNAASPIAKQLRRNRKIEPYLGTEVTPGQIDWYKLGTYWSYSWEVPTGGLTASVIGFDTIGLLDITSFREHGVLINKSLGELIDYVLLDAKNVLPFLDWTVDNELYDWVVPYAWFEAKSHTAALRKISSAFPMHIYCDRQGRIIAAPQKLSVDDYVDVWSDSTNVIDRSYSSLYAVVPNIVNVAVVKPALADAKELASDTSEFNVASIKSRTLNFSAPYVADLAITVDCDSTVSYTYAVHSWGIDFYFDGTGNVRSIKCIGTALDTSAVSTITYRDDQSILVNGAVTRDVSSDLIQSDELASYILSRIIELSADDKYDVEVTYRGDIALSINDPILLLDGSSSTNYNIKRHQLSWDGSLTGSAHLNT